MRGVALINAVTIVAEVGDFARFGNARQLMAYLGLVPSEHSSGIRVRRGKHNKSRIVVLNGWNSWVLQAVAAYTDALREVYGLAGRRMG